MNATHRIVNATSSPALLLAGTLGFAGGRFLHRQKALPREFSIDVDEALVRDLGVIENRRLYDNVESIDFLRALGYI